jgi:putative acetyltransferase
MVIRSEQPEDHAKIDETNRLAFGQPDEARLVAAIRQADGFDPSLSLVAIRDGQLVGHILFSPISIVGENGEVPAFALAPMAVRPECQRQGIGSELVAAGLQAARLAGHRIVIVLGHAKYYPRFGFVRCSQFGITSPFPAPDEAFMVMALTPGSLEDVSGEVRYPAAFGGP